MKESTELSRDLGPFAVFSITAGTMIGAGIFVLPGLAIQDAGPASMISFGLAGVISMCAALSVSELATGMPKAGGSYYFLSRTFGPVAGSIVGWGCYLGLVFKGAFALVGFGEYMLAVSPVGDFIPLSLFPAFLVDNEAIIIGIVICGALLLVNIIGAKASGSIQIFIVIILLFILGVFCAWGGFSVDFRNHSPFFSEGVMSVFAATGLVFVSYLGIVKVSALAEEVHNPGRNLPLGMIGSVFGITILYVLVMFVVIGIGPVEELAGAKTAVSFVARRAMGEGGDIFLGIGGLLATLSTGNAAILAASRFTFAMGRDNLMMDWVSRVNERFQTPGRAIMISGLIMGVLMMSANVETIAKLAGVFNIVIFALLNLAVIMLRVVEPTWYDPEFRSPFYPWVQIFGMIAALALVPQMGLNSIMAAFVFLLWGIGWVLFYAGDDALPELSFFDIFRRMDHESALEHVRGKIEEEEEITGSVHVGLFNPEEAETLVRMASWFARGENPVIHVVIPREVPVQSSLQMFEPAAEPREAEDKHDSDLPTDVHQNLLEIAEQRGCELRVTTLITHDERLGVVHFAGDHNADLLLLDWPDEFLRSRLVGSYVHKAVQEAPCDVAVFKDRGLSDIQNILLATTIGPHDDLEVRLSSAIARQKKGSITFFHVVPEKAKEEQEEKEREYMLDLADLQDVRTEVVLVRSDDVVREILQAGEDCDLFVMGAANHMLYRNMVFGTVPTTVAGETNKPVLMVRKKRSVQQGLFRAIVDQLLYWDRGSVPVSSPRENPGETRDD